MEVKIAHKIII